MKFIVFDCDGTLVDAQYGHIAAVHFTLDCQNIPRPSRSDILLYVGAPIKTAMHEYAPEADEETLDRLVALYQQKQAELSQKNHRGEILYPGMFEILQNLAARDDILLGMVTMKSRRGVERVLRVHDLENMFQNTKSADDGPGKPAPDLLLRAISECDVTADDTIMVGDTNFDIQMARTAGAHTIGVTWGYQSAEELEEAKTDAIATTSEELQDLLMNFINK